MYWEMHMLSRLTGFGSLLPYQEDQGNPSYSVFRREIPKHHVILTVCILLACWTLNALYDQYNLRD